MTQPTGRVGAPNIAIVPVGGGGGEGLARAQADLVRLRAGGGEVRRPGWVYAVLVLVIVTSLALPFILVSLLT
jgi:hypothetical protein